jgi:hypothetical protein
MMRGGAKQAILSHDFREQQEQREGRRWHDAVQRQGQAELNMQAKLAAEHSRMRQRIREKKLKGGLQVPSIERLNHYHSQRDNAINKQLQSSSVATVGPLRLYDEHPDDYAFS